MYQYRLENTKTGEILGFDRAENALEIVKKYDLATRENAHIRIICTGTEYKHQHSYNAGGYCTECGDGRDNS